MSGERVKKAFKHVQIDIHRLIYLDFANMLKNISLIQQRPAGANQAEPSEELSILCLLVDLPKQTGLEFT